ncbi:MAG: hypothetical protein AVDCRST_MAG18-3015, partial [uncultured Thermomicrobiales bacterium]
WRAERACAGSAISGKPRWPRACRADGTGCSWTRRRSSSAYSGATVYATTLAVMLI